MAEAAAQIIVARKQKRKEEGVGLLKGIRMPGKHFLKSHHHTTAEALPDHREQDIPFQSPYFICLFFVCLFMV